MASSTTRLRVAITATVTAVGLGLLAPPAASAAPGDGTAATYTNPVSHPDADTFADPAVIRGKDGHWYAYGTTDPLTEGETGRHILPIMRSDDLVDWDYVGDAFTEATLPDWADRSRGAALWAPDIRYVDGRYRLYYVVTETTETGVPQTTTEVNDNAIGVAYSDSPTGPWVDSGDPVVDPRRADVDNYRWTFDPHMVVGPGGREYLYYGSYYGGIFVTELAENGSEAVGPATQVAIDNKYEGAYVVQRDGWWYLFASSANCCAGPTTGYSVHVGRSRSVTGPFVDREGVRMDRSRAGGTPVLYQNGNRWIGAGHNAVVTDLAGQDWIAYHAIDRADPYLNGTDGINERPMLLDRLDWIDGWPITRAGAGPSEDAQRGPVTGPVLTDFGGRPAPGWQTDGGWRPVTSEQAGTSYVANGNREHTLLTAEALPADVRVEADLRLSDYSRRGEYGLTAAVDGGSVVEAVIDAVTGTLALRATQDGRVTAQQTGVLPAGFDDRDWHALSLQIRDGVATAELTHARLHDPLAHLELAVPDAGVGRAGAVARINGAQVDNLSALRAADPVTERIPEPQQGTLLAGPSDEFDGGIEAGWERVRDPQVTVAGGQLVWPVEQADLTGDSDSAGILLRDAPDGDWTAVTKLTIDLGTDLVRNFQQGGLIAYVDDDLFTRLSHVAIYNTRQTEFGKEMPYAGRLSYGGTIIGPPAETTWLRLTHRVDPANGEHELQASTSRDGSTWVVGGVWTLPADADLRIGLVSHGWNGADPRATSQFDWFRVYGG